jgi:DNA-binding response OmpR family regulator
MPHLPVWIDLNNFDKVLVNILSNAFKFTPENGGIVIKLATGTDADIYGPLSQYCEITVSDTGSGIHEDKIEKIFERFYQVDHTQMNVNFGTGIGLHLARTLVELMHGKIFARNRHDGQGSEFIIRLPLGSDHIPAAELETQIEPLPHKITEIIQLDEQDEINPQYNVRPRTKYRVLIVEDESDIRHYLSGELSDTYRISECTNGREALDFILKEKPDLVICDVMMPEMDGITLCKKLKSNVNINHIPIILLTARSSDEDKAEGFDIGADAYVAKPFNLELLRKRVANILENRERLELKRGDQTNPNIPLIKQVVLKSSDQILLEKITRIINQNIDNPDLNVEMLAEGVGMSRVHMHRKLKELTNQSARDFIRTIRLRQAAELLSNQKLTVSEVAYALGFSNLSHFSNTFREFYGVSPKEFGDNNRKANNS